MVAFTSFYTRRKNGVGIFAAGDFSTINPNLLSLRLGLIAYILPSSR